VPSQLDYLVCGRGKIDRAHSRPADSDGGCDVSDSAQGSYAGPCRLTNAGTVRTSSRMSSHIDQLCR
jgi:hypothetical protein